MKHLQKQETQLSGGMKTSLAVKGCGGNNWSGSIQVTTADMHSTCLKGLMLWYRTRWQLVRISQQWPAVPHSDLCVIPHTDVAELSVLFQVFSEIRHWIRVYSYIAVVLPIKCHRFSHIPFNGKTTATYRGSYSVKITAERAKMLFVNIS